MKKRLLLLPIIVITIIMTLGIGFKTIIQKTSLLSFLNGTTLEEKELSTVANQMYVTMLDDKAKVVATTNPETQVDGKYAFTDNTKPQVQPNTKDNYFILFEITDTNGSSGYTKVEENVIYTLELPEYITPTDFYDEGIEPNEQCTNFTKKGDTIACGGIYKKGDKFTFKVIFKNVINKRNVKAAYQFPITLNKSIEEIVFTLKTIDFGLPGAIQLYMEKIDTPIPPIEETDYTLDIDGDWTSDTENYITWTVTLTDNSEENYRTNGELYIDFGTNMAMPTDQDHLFERFKIYKDNVLQETYNYSSGLYILPSYGPREALATINSEVELDTSSIYTKFIKGLKIDLSKIDYQNTPLSPIIEGVHEWKFEITTKKYTNDLNPSTATVKYIDNLYNGEYEKTKTIKHKAAEYNVTLNEDDNNKNIYGIPESISYHAKGTCPYKIITIEDIPDIDWGGNLKFHYYLDGIGFTQEQNALEPTLNIKINGQDIHFKKYGYFAQSTVNGQTGNTDPAVLKLMAETDNYLTSNSNSYFRSDEVNIDGDYYWLVLSEHTKDIGNSISRDGRIEYVEKSGNSAPIPAKWKIYLFNASRTNLEISWDQDLGYNERQFTAGNGGGYGNRIKINDAQATSSLNCQVYTPIKTVGKMIEDGFIEWDIKFDNKYIFNTQERTKEAYLIVYVPDNLTILNNGFVEMDTGKIYDNYNTNDRNKIPLANLGICQSGHYINHNDIYDNFKCDSWTIGNNFTSGLPVGRLNTSSQEIISSFNIIPNRFDIRGYNAYYVKFDPKILRDNQTIYDGISRLSFFTKNTGSKIYDENNKDMIYVEVLGTTLRKDFDTDRVLESPYNIGDTTEISYVYTTLGGMSNRKISKDIDEEETKNNANNIEKLWRVFARQSGSLTFGGHPYDYIDFGMGTFPIFYNGKYQFTDKFITNNQTEKIVAKNTKLGRIKIYLYSNYNSNYDGVEIVVDDYTNLELDSNGYYNYCYKYNCIKLKFNYGENCQTYNSNNPACSRENENLENGFEIIVDGNVSNPIIVTEYSTKTDLDRVIDELRRNNLDISSIDITNFSTQYNWKNNPQLAQSDNAITTYELLADLSVEKKVDTTDDTNYKNDTKNHELVATIGNSPTDYLNLTDFIDGIGSIGISDTTAPENVSTNYNDLKEIRKYLHITDLVISVKNHYNSNSDYTKIYENNSFTPEYDGSTIEYIEDTNELYKIHLVRSDGEKIPPLTDIKVTYKMNFYLDEEDNYRLKDIYNGQKYYISTNVETVRTYESNPILMGTSSTKKVLATRLSSTDGNYENKIDSTNHTLTAYASNNGVEVGADYLYPGEIEKNLYTSNNNVDTWYIKYTPNSTGKSEKVSMKIKDSLSFKIEGNSQYNNSIINILNEYTTFKNIRINYNGKDTKLDDEAVYVWANPIENRNINFNNITGKLIKGDRGFELQLEPFNYGDVIIVKYDIEVDYEMVYKKLQIEGFIDKNNKLTDTHKNLIINYDNGINLVDYPESFVEKSKSNISISEFAPTVHKKNKGRTNDETSWEVNFNTGNNSNYITIKDNLKITTEDESMQSIIEEATILKDLEIKIDGQTIYSNDTFTEPWSDNITIDKKDLGYEFIFKDTSENSFINQNKKVVITYKSALDFNKYKGKDKSGVYSLENTAIIEKNGISSKDVLESNGIPFDFPLVASKSFLGNSTNDLTETNWKYTIESGKMDRENVHIKDIVTLGKDFGNYLSISKLKITKNNEVIYDSSNNINQLEGIELLDGEGNKLQLNQNGIYEFDLVIDKLEKMSTINVEYTLKVDKEEYINNNELLDDELLIQNKIKVTAEDGTDIEKESRGSSKVPSKLLKKFDFLGYDNNGNPKIKWYIDINLLSDYSLEELAEKQVIVTDSLSDVLGLVDGSVQLKEMKVTSNGTTINRVIDSSKYELNTDNNILTITITNPSETNSFEISFETICYASLSEIENSATLQVGEEKTEVDISKRVQIFSPYSFGRVSSNDVLTYHIKGKKYFDDELSNKAFVFEIQEVNEAGEIIEGGFYSRNTNAEDGTITFNGLNYFEEGTYYYRIKEINDNDQNIIYDTTEYIIKIEVEKNGEEYFIEDISLINNKNDEIEFYNKSKPEEPNIVDIIVNPNTGKTLFIILLIPIILILGKYIKKKYTIN